jgi:type I restriction enzyme M protein
MSNVTQQIVELRARPLEDAESLPEPDLLAQEIAYDLLTALEQFSSLAEILQQ